MRYLALNPMLIALTAALGLAGCRAAGANAHVREMLVAGGICLLAAELAALPALLQHKSAPQQSIFQAALIGTVVHLGVILALSIAALLLARLAPAFVWWLLPMYWITLIGLCTAFTLLMRTPARVGLT